MPPRSRFTFNEASGRYHDSRSGKFISSAAVRASIDHALRQAGREMNTLAERLRTGQIGLSEWEIGTKALIKDIHVGSAAMARGGWAQMRPADYGRVGQLVREQYRFLRNFVEQIKAGLPLDGRFIRRVALYAQAGRRTFHNRQLLEMRTRQFKAERSILHPADHCSQCVSEAARGWQPIGAIIPIGERECLVACRCSMSYR